MRRSKQGLTLVEVMVALVFTGIAFTALALSQVTGFQVTRASQDAAVAKDLAMRQVELFRSYGFDPFDRCPTFNAFDDEPVVYADYPACSDSEISTDHPAFTIAWELTNQPAGIKLMTPPALVEIEVTVRWQSGSESKSYVLTSYLSCGDPGEGVTTNVPCPTQSLRGP